MRGNTLKSEFYCCKCGQRGIPIQRSRARTREKGHIKDLYCVHCNQVTQHIEKRSCDFELLLNTIN